MVMYKYVRTECTYGAITYREIRDILPRRRAVYEGHTFKKKKPTLNIQIIMLVGCRDAVLGLSAVVHVCLELLVWMRHVRQQHLTRDDSMTNYQCI